MRPHEITVLIDEAFAEQVSTESLRHVALATLLHQKVDSACDLAVVVTDDEVSQELNSRHLGIDAPTDVLAFPNVARGPFADLPGQTRYLGDVIVSFPRADAQARDLGHEVVAELQLLVVHGVLHLLGYDDILDDKRARMWAAQGVILSALGIAVHLPD